MLRRELPDSLPNAARPRVLDLGCGGGIVAEALAAGGCTVVGLDPSLPSLRAARRHAHGGAPEAPSYLGGAGERLPLAEGSFDAIVCADTLEHVADLDATVARDPPCAASARDAAVRHADAKLADAGHSALGAELLRLVPRRAHVYERLLTPEDLAARCAQAGLVLREVRGAELVRSPPAAAWSYLQRRELGGFRLGVDTRFVFLGYAVPRRRLEG